MTTKAIITRRGFPQSDAIAASAAAEAEVMGLRVEHRLPQGLLVRGEEDQYDRLAKQGYRVKLLRDTNVMDVGAYRIDTEGTLPRVPARHEVPREQRASWPHHLVQLAAPPQEEWIRAIEARGVNVVEPISAYGLFVVGLPEQVKALENLDFVEWTGLFKPAYRISPSLLGMRGRIRNVNVGVYPEEAAGVVREGIERAGGEIVGEWRQVSAYRDAFHVLLAELDAAALPAVAALPPVRWVELQGPDVLYDERSSQIVAEALNNAAPPNTGPVTGYQANLTSLGLSGAGVTIGIVDTGVDTHNNATMHADLAGRLAFFVDASGGGTTVDMNGHGTHVAGIAAGNAATGDADPQGFLLGQGVAPGAQFGSVNAISTGGPFMLDNTRVLNVVSNGGSVMNNSWGASGVGAGYTSRSQTYDQRVRDPDPATAGLEHLVVVSAAGNEGGAATTIGEPWECKNPIVVGNSLNFRPGELFPSDDIRGISGTSSRGPAVDTRVLPTVVAPGTNIVSARSTVDTDPVTPGAQRPRTAYTDTGATVHANHTALSGTSMATPHVAGVCALLTEWWRNRTGGRNPSPALLKALLVNGAEDLAGGENWRCVNSNATDKAAWSLQSGSIFQRTIPFVPAALVEGNTTLTQVAALANINAAGRWFFDGGTNTLFVRTSGSNSPGANSVPLLHARDTQALANLPNGDQGWGRVSLENMLLQAPDSDRGPRIFSDQRHAFDAGGQEFTIRVAPVNTGPQAVMRITLAWTDAAGAVNANPALVNDLDLEVTELGTGNVYQGNVFAGGVSTTGGAFDDRNNVECVYVQNPAGTYEVTVIAANIAASALPGGVSPWQDFALVIENAEVPAAEPVSVVPVIDRSGSMVSAGYVDVTRTSSKQFVDLMGVDDQLGVVSFGSTSTVEYPTGPNPALQTITGQPVRDAAKAEIDGIVFGGCTFMGAGINAARDLLAPAAAGSRAMVLLSDGFDNKGCDPGNAAKPSAMDAAGGLPAGMPVYTCAMGPASDQALLEQIADATDGRYYYMPTIDDLFEIYNYIRGQVTGDSLVVNESALASRSRVAAFVDALATEATFAVAWGDPTLRYVRGAPRTTREISVRLRDPQGRLLHAGDSYVRRIVGDGYVVFKLREPMPGEWQVEVETARAEHTRYTVGGFVRSPLRLLVALRPVRIATGTPLQVSTRVFDGTRPLSGYRASVRVVRPGLGIPALLQKHRAQLRDIKAVRVPGGDALPPDLAKLTALRSKLLKEGKPDLFASAAGSVALRPASAADLPRIDFPASFHRLSIPGTPRAVPAGRPAELVTAPTGVSGPIAAVARPGSPTLSAGGLVGQFRDTTEPGSYNVAVNVSGTSPASGARFVRKELVSVLIR
jgi:subtilisin family serine protease